MVNNIVMGFLFIDLLVILYLMILLRRLLVKSKPIAPVLMKPVKKRENPFPAPKKEALTKKRKKRTFLTKDQAEEIKKLHSTGRKRSSIAKEYNVSVSYIHNITNGKVQRFKKGG